MTKIFLSPSSNYPQRTHAWMLDFLDPQMLAAQESRQYLIWDREGEETTVDHVTTTLFEAAEKGEDPDQTTRGRSRVRSRKGRKHEKKHGKGKKSKGKKKKRSTSSTSSDSSDASSSDKPSSESEEKEAQQQHGTPAWKSL